METGVSWIKLLGISDPAFDNYKKLAGIRAT